MQFKASGLNGGKRNREGWGGKTLTVFPLFAGKSANSSENPPNEAPRTPINPTVGYGKGRGSSGEKFFRIATV